MSRYFCLVLTSAVVFSCGGGGPAQITQPPPPPAPTHGTVTATVDGVNWSLFVWTAPIRCRPDCLLFTARKAYMGLADSLEIAVELFAFDTTGVAPASLGVDGPNRASVYRYSEGWGTLLPGGGGTARVTMFTVGGASGTFSFTAVPYPNTGATGTKLVSNGTFNLTF